MLALYEMDDVKVPKSGLLKHEKGPFRLNMSGASNSIRYTIEFLGLGHSLGRPDSYDENKLQSFYESEVEMVFISQRNSQARWLDDNISAIPCLGFELGVQTQIRRGKASAARDHILGPSPNAAMDRSKSATVQTKRKDEIEVEKTPQALKSRTLSLFDRVRAKQLASSSVTGPTPESILRCRAIGRINEVVDILRMKQQQRLGSGKVSFSMGQVVYVVKSSLSVPIADDEIQMCVEILANDVPGGWLTRFNMGSVQTVILTGAGMGGAEVKRILNHKERQ